MGANCCGSSASTTTEIAVPTIPPQEHPELVNQVTKIQAVYRGHKVRKEYETCKDGKEDENSKDAQMGINQKNSQDPKFIFFFLIFFFKFLIQFFGFSIIFKNI